MSFASNFKTIPARGATSAYSNNNRPILDTPPSTSAFVYQQPLIVGMRTPLPESEPMTEYSELQLTPTRARPVAYQQQNQPKGPMTPGPGPQRVLYQNVRGSPYFRPSTPSLLPPPSPQCFITHYNDQTFIMQPVTSTSTSISNNSSPAKNNKSVTFNSPLPKNKKSNNKNPTQPPVKVSSVSRTRYMIGSIEQVVRWHKMAKKADIYVIYEIPAIVESIVKSRSAYNIILRSEQKNNTLPLQAVFYPIDRDLPSVKIGQLVMCHGRMVGANKLQVFSIRPSAESLAGLKRISFLCQHALQEAEP